MVQKATDSQIESFLSNYPFWVLSEGKLYRKFKFVDFSEAFAFMTRVALVAERESHHPEWCNTYNWVEVNLITHQVGGITEKDIQLALTMERLAP